MIVKDVMDEDFRTIDESMPVRDILNLFTHHHHLAYAVVNRHGNIIGMISLEGLKPLLANEGVWDWMVADDVKAPALDIVAVNEPLGKILDEMKRLQLEQAPVVETEGSLKPIGLMDIRIARNLINAELLKRRSDAQTDGPDVGEDGTPAPYPEPAT
jgi:CIC family chloride channel protein